MRGRRRRGVVMFWGERGEDLGRIGKNEWKREKRKMNQKGVIVGCFFLLWIFGGLVATWKIVSASFGRRKEGLR